MSRGTHVMYWSLLIALAGPLSGEAVAQTIRGVPHASGPERIVQEWALRGVIISAARQSALIEHLPSGRWRFLGMGAEVSESLAIVTIDADRVVLKADEGVTVTLRLGHGGQERIVRRPAKPARAVPLPLIGPKASAR